MGYLSFYHRGHRSSGGWGGPYIILFYQKTKRAGILHTTQMSTQSNANITADKVHTIYAWVMCPGYGYGIQSRYLPTHLSCSLYMLAHLSGLSLLWSKEGTEIITAVKVATRATCAPNAIFCEVSIVLLPCRFHAYFKRRVRYHSSPG